MDIVDQAYRELLQNVFGESIPEDVSVCKVHGIKFDKARRAVERKYKLYEDEEAYASWITVLLLHSPLFYTEDELKRLNSQ